MKLQKNWKKSFMAFQCQGCDKTFSSCIDFVIDFSWSFRKKLEERFHGISIPRLWYKVFLLHLFCYKFFMKLQKKLETGRNLLWLLNAQTVIKRFLFALILFLIFHEAIIYYNILMPRLWYNFFFLHWFCSWIFMKLQKKLETERYLSWLFNAQAVIQHFLSALILFLTFHEASEKN